LSRIAFEVIIKKYFTKFPHIPSARADPQKRETGNLSLEKNIIALKKPVELENPTMLMMAGIDPMTGHIRSTEQCIDSSLASPFFLREFELRIPQEGALHA
jgi:hypothetical protein